MGMRILAVIAVLLFAISPGLRAAVVNVTDIRCSPAAGAYGVGDTVSIAVTFSAAVNVTTASSKLHLGVGRAANDAYAVPAANAAGITTVTFRYVVVTGDVSADLEYTDTGALSGVTGYNGTLKPPGDAASLGGTSAVIIDGIAPTISLSGPGPISRTAPVDVAITPSEALASHSLTSGDFMITLGTVSLSGSTLAVSPGSPVTAAAKANAGAVSIKLSAPTSTHLAQGAPLTIGSALYQVEDAVDVTTATAVTLRRGLDTLLASGTSVFTASGASVTVKLAAGTCQDAAGNDNTGSASVTFRYDPTPPVATVTAPDSGDASLRFTVKFSEVVVDALTTADLQATNGDITAIDGTRNPTFTVTVAPIVATSDVMLGVVADGVHDAAGNGNIPASATFKPLAVQSVASTPAAKTYKIGQTVPITVTLNKDVPYVHGTGATLHLKTGGAGTDATCASPINDQPAIHELTFAYTVVAGDTAADLDYLAAGSLDLHGGKLAGLTTVALPAPATAGSLAATCDIVIDGVKPTATIADPGDFRASSPIDLLVTFSETVTDLVTDDFVVTGATASLAGSGEFYTLSLEPTSPLAFATAATAGTVTVHLIATSDTPLAAGAPLRVGDSVYRVKNAKTVATTSTAVVLTTGLATSVAGGTPVFGPTGTRVAYSLPTNACEDGAGNGNAAVSTATFTYDPTPPAATIDMATSTTDVAFLVTFSETTGSTLTAGGVTTDNCRVVSIDSSENPTFRVAVAITNPAQNFSLGLLEGAVQDDAGNESLAQDPDIFYVKPHPTNVSAVNADGTYGKGVRLRLKVMFSEPVVITGSPTLALAMDAGTRTAVYAEGSGSADLLFDYTIVAGDAADDLDYASTTALSLNGGTLRDADDNDAVLTLKAPGASGSLSANADLHIDAAGPSGPGKPDVGDLPDDSSGCGAGSGIAILLSLGWLTPGFRRRNRH